MTKKNGTKRSLLMSAVALVLCFSMLVGSTFAWFTDSVTSSGNIIKSGKLDVEMSWADGKADPTDAATVWTDASAGAIFDNDKWEPGYTEVRHIQIKNAGTLALKYQLNIAANGDVSELADAIDVYYFDGAKQIADRAALANETVFGTLTDALAGMSTTASGNLPAGEAHTITIALKMRESAGNEYQNLAIGSDFAVKLMATQLTAEEDAFDDQYDKGAWHPDFTVTSVEDLAAALANGGKIQVNGTLNAGATQDVPNWTNAPAEFIFDATTLDALKGGKYVLEQGSRYGVVGLISAGESLALSDMEITANSQWPVYLSNYGGTLTLDNIDVTATQGAGIYPYGTNGTTTIKTATVNQEALSDEFAAITPWAGTAIATSNGHRLIIEDGTYIGSNQGVYIYNSGAVVTINGGTFKAPQVLKADGSYSDQTIRGEFVVNGGNFDGQINMTNGYAYCTINGGNFTNFSVSSYSPVVIKGGTFDADPSAYVADGYEVVDNGNGAYTVQLSTATGAEIKDQLNDSTTTNVVLGQDVDLDDPAFQSNGNMSLTVKDGKTLDLNNNSVIRPASGSGSGVVIPGGATTTVKNGSIISEGDMTSIDIASGAAATFENMEFVGNGSSFARVRANSNAKTTLIFRECSFTNATVEITGMNGACDVDIQFIGCTFEGSYKMYDENGNLLTDPHGNVHYTSELFSAESNYIYGSFTFDDCTFDYDASESRYDRSVIALYGPKASYGKTLTVTLKDVTVTGEKIIPVTVDSRYKASVTIVEEGTNTYTNNGVAVNYDGSTK